MAGASLKAALIVNILIALIKFTVGLLSRSAAMIAEGWHSAADSLNQVLLVIGVRHSKKKPDLEHPFGYSKAQFFWAFVVAVLIFGISGTLAFLEGFEILMHPDEHHIKHDMLIYNLIVLGAAIILESYAFRAAYVEVRAHQKKIGSKSFVGALDEMQDPVLLSLLTEDSLALVGLLIAFCGISITWITENAIVDGITSLIIGLVLMIGGLLLAKNNQAYLVGKAVTPRVQLQIKEIVVSHQAVKEMHSMKTMLLGPKDMILTLELEFTEAAKVDVAPHIDDLESKLVDALPRLKPGKIFIEAQ